MSANFTSKGDFIIINVLFRRGKREYMHFFVYDNQSKDVIE